MTKSNNKLKNTKKYSSKYHLKRELEIIIETLYDLKRTFQLYRYLLFEDNYSLAYKNFPHMFAIMLKSMEEKVILGLYKVAYDNDNSISITDVVETYKNNKNNFTEKKYYYIKNIDNDRKIRRYLNPQKINSCIIQIENDLNKTKGLKEFLRNFRRKTIAHLDKRFTFNTRIKYNKGTFTYSDIKSLIDDLIEDINSLYNSIFGSTYAFLYSELDELKYLNNLIKTNFDNKYKGKSFNP